MFLNKMLVTPHQIYMDIDGLLFSLDEDNSSVEILSSPVALICVTLTKTNQYTYRNDVT